MADELNVLEIANEHLVLHLLAPGEADIAYGESGQDVAADDSAAGADNAADARGAAASSADAANATDAADAREIASSNFLPENQVEDFVDEVLDAIDEAGELYDCYVDWEKPFVFGFVDGVLAVADESWSALEDSYYEDMRNQDFAAIDAAIDQIAQDFEGERPWDEAAKGNVRKILSRPGQNAAKADTAYFTVYAHGFFYGADAAYDMEWRVVVTPAHNLLLTDEDAVTEASLARLQAESGKGGSLIDRLFDMVGIDLDEIASAIEAEFSDDLEDPIEVECADGSDASGPDAPAGRDAN